MTPDERLEAVARALWAQDDAGFPRFTQQHWEEGTALARSAYLARAKAALSAAYPELSAGTHWLAPREATDAMARAFLSIKSSVPDDPRAGPTMAQAWTAARDAYLKEGGNGG